MKKSTIGFIGVMLGVNSKLGSERIKLCKTQKLQKQYHGILGTDVKKVSPGCKNCFVYKMDQRYGRDTTIFTKGKTTYELERIY